MKILVIGRTRFFGIHMVEELLKAGHDITIATRGKASDTFGNRLLYYLMDYVIKITATVCSQVAVIFCVLIM